ncbi:YtpI family protein [Alteribacillus sp. HJP-4]|uniref:YtpI family protein n=1 Tax=Alteribacillus sp. HJP-4 TaxID=2775394 RepID=UPI0035CCFCCF
MQIFTIIVVIAAAMYVFYKIKAFRTKAPVEKKWVQTKANISLGLFLTGFGANLLFTNTMTIDIVIGTIFAVLGIANILLGLRAYKLYHPYASKEAEEQRLKT